MVWIHKNQLWKHLWMFIEPLLWRHWWSLYKVAKSYFLSAFKNLTFLWERKVPKEIVMPVIIMWQWGSLVVQWLRICLPMQGTWVRALVRDDPTCCGATKPLHHNYWACALEPTSHNYRACLPQLLKPACLEPVLRNKRSHHSEKPTCRNEE